MMLHGTEHFFGLSGSAAPAASPHNLLPTPCLLAAVAEWGKERALTLGKGCAAIAKTLVCCQHCPATNPKHSTTAAATKKVSSIPARPSALFNLSSQQMWWPCQKSKDRIQGQDFLTGPSCLAKWNPLPCYLMMHFICSCSEFCNSAFSSSFLNSIQNRSPQYFFGDKRQVLLDGPTHNLQCLKPDTLIPDLNVTLKKSTNRSVRSDSKLSVAIY